MVKIGHALDGIHAIMASPIAVVAPLWLAGMRQLHSEMYDLLDPRSDTATIEVIEVVPPNSEVSKCFEVSLGTDQAKTESDLRCADEWLRGRYAPLSEPLVMIALLMLHQLVLWADDEGAVPTVPSLGALAALLGVPIDVVRQMNAVQYSTGTMQQAFEVGRLVGLVAR